MRKKTGNRLFKSAQDQEISSVGFKKIIVFLALTIAFCGTFYLYQVNDLANKGYEVKEIENKIARLKEINEKNKIQEVELRSMYNIERATENLDLVNSSNVSYLEIDGPVAMK